MTQEQQNSGLEALSGEHCSPGVAPPPVALPTEQAPPVAAPPLVDWPADSGPPADAAQCAVAAAQGPPRPRVWSALVLALIAIPSASIVGGFATAVPALILNWEEISAARGDQQAVMNAIMGFVATPFGLICSILPAELTYLAIVLMAVQLSPQPWRQRLAMHRPGLPWWTFLLFAAATPAFAMIGGLLASFLRGEEEGGSLKFIFDMFQNMPLALAPVAVLLYSVAPGFAEEMVFRGYVQSRLLARWHPVAAIGVASVLFAVAHIDPTHALVVWPMGVWLGIVAWRTGTIWPAIAAHAGMNAYGVSTMLALTAEDVAAMEDRWTLFQVAVLVISGAALLASCAYLLFGRRGIARCRQSQ